MGSLTANATLSYEHVDGTVYSKELGSPDRTIVGYNYNQKYTTVHDSLMDSQFWGDLRREAKTNIALQNALNHAILIFNLSNTRQ
jgi:hypothetical protein